MDEMEKAERINKIETNLIARIMVESDKSPSDEVLTAIAILAKRPGERIDEVLLYATQCKFGSVSRAAFKALKTRISYMDSQ